MHHRKLTEVLKALSSEQISRLTDFIRSPYFNKNKSLTSLYDYLKSLHPDYPQDAVINKTILKKVTGFDDENDLAKKMTRLLDLIDRFLSMEYNQDKVLEQIGTLKAYKKLHLNKHFESLAHQLRKDLKDDPFHDFDYLWRLHKLEEESFEGFNQGLVRTPDSFSDEVLKSLTRFYFSKKLRYMAEAVYRERLFGNVIGSDIKEEVLGFLGLSQKDEDLYLMLYGNIFKMNLEKSPQEALPYYQRIKTILKAFQESIPKEEIRSISVYLHNFCLTQSNKGDKTYLRELLEIVQFRINKNALLENSKLNPQLFKNTVGAALKLNETSWAKSFINEFKRYLPHELRSDYYNLAVGQLYYHKKNYIGACKHLAIASHNKNDVYFGFAVKKLLLKIGYESNDIFLLAPFIATYKKHLERHRHKIGENAFILDQFFKYFRLLVSADKDLEKMEILLSKLLTEPNFADKDWLISMASQRKPVTKKLQSVYINRF